jgi:hypothetical protein
MKSAALTGLLMIIPTLSLAQIPVSLSPNQQQMLNSQDSELQRNKALVYDFVREVLEARHVELTPGHHPPRRVDSVNLRSIMYR